VAGGRTQSRWPRAERQAMSRIFITGSADGLGQMAARVLVDAGHRVVLHARNEKRASEARAQVPGAEDALSGDLASVEQTKRLADEVNRMGAFDAVIHNAAIGYREPRRVVTVDGLSQVFAINTLAPYILTALIDRPHRLIYLSSGLHRGADASLTDLNWEKRPWNGMRAYADSKLHDAMLAGAAARRWKNVFANALEPGWVSTKMGGPGAPDDLDAGAHTQVWLATSDDPGATVSGRYFYHQKLRAADPAMNDSALQDRLIDACARVSAVAFPE
jgi:NAD(P)-dependent dehydrogenase (short-subunit alcohol dehydrogenase family)